MAAQPLRTDDIPVAFKGYARGARPIGRTYTSTAGMVEPGTTEVPMVAGTPIFKDAPAGQVLHVGAPVAKQSVDAVVSSVGDVSVLLSCRMGTGVVEIQLPVTLVPQDLRIFGQPVYVALDNLGGYRAPRVTKRVVEPAEDEEIRELEGWLNSL